MKKFINVVPEIDTKIHSIDYIKIDTYDCRHEAWSWDGVLGESLIFCTKDFKNPKKEVLQIVHKLWLAYRYAKLYLVSLQLSARPPHSLIH